jgi:UDP-2,3-diacylglucosamine hydrolase
MGTESSLMNVASLAPPTAKASRNTKAYFIADAHLGGEPEPAEGPKRTDLIRFLAHLEGRASVLFLLGDIFDFWFEYPRTTSTEHPEVLSALRRLSEAGTDIHFLGGNHDYWAGSRLEMLTGARVHRQPIEVTLFAERLFIAHGDGLPDGDSGYRLLKAVLRNRLAIAAFGLIPPRIGRAIARWASGLSEITEEGVRLAVPSMRAFLEKVLAQGHDAAVVAHVHRPVIWRGKNGVGVIVGDWMANRSVVRLDENGFRMLRWSNGTLEDNERAAMPPAAGDGSADLADPRADSSAAL